jgi:putative tryptophan/tyrosine transport system substrate-binding protein
MNRPPSPLTMLLSRHTRRREFIAGLAAAVAWPVVARAQQRDRVRRVGVLTPYGENDPTTKVLLRAFVQRLAALGWSEGHNLRLDDRSVGDLERVRFNAKELVAQQPDVILVDSTPHTAALQRETRTIPIVFVGVSDPVGSGFVAGLPRPGGNITGFTAEDPSMAGKRVELLNEIAPGRKLVAAVFNPDTAPFVRTYYLPQFEAATRSLGLQSIVAPVHNEAEIETVMTSLGRGPAASVVLMPDGFLYARRARIISLAAQYSLPTVSLNVKWVVDGGLLFYGPDYLDFYRRAADYVDRILQGARPEDLPVQLPVKFEMAVNVKTAKAIGLTISESFLLRADEVIE